MTFVVTLKKPGEDVYSTIALGDSADRKQIEHAVSTAVEMLLAERSQDDNVVAIQDGSDDSGERV